MSASTDPSAALRSIFEPLTPEQARQDRQQLWNLLQQAWNTLATIERETRTLRHDLPEGSYELKLRLTTVETLARIRLAKPRRILRQLAADFQELSAEGDTAAYTPEGMPEPEPVAREPETPAVPADPSVSPRQGSELDARVAEVVMGLPVVWGPPRHPRPGLEGGSYPWLDGAAHGRTYDWHPVNGYSKYPQAAALVEERIAELGLQDAYVGELLELVDPGPFAMITASPEQRCRAALAAVQQMLQPVDTEEPSGIS